MKDMLQQRHIGISPADEQLMLQTIGANSIEELIEQTIPANIRLAAPIELPEPLSEHQYINHISELASQNKVFTSYIGQGWYNTIMPAVIQRNINNLKAKKIPHILFIFFQQATVQKRKLKSKLASKFRAIKYKTNRLFVHKHLF